MAHLHITSLHIRRAAISAAIGCTALAVWSSSASAVPIGLYDTAPKATVVKASPGVDSRRPTSVIVRYHR